MNSYIAPILRSMLLIWKQVNWRS